MSNQKGMLVDFASVSDNGVRAISITVLRFFQLTITANANQGAHVTVGLGMSRIEFSLGFGVWDRWLR